MSLQSRLMAAEARRRAENTKDSDASLCIFQARMVRRHGESKEAYTMIREGLKAIKEGASLKEVCAMFDC